MMLIFLKYKLAIINRFFRVSLSKFRLFKLIIGNPQNVKKLRRNKIYHNLFTNKEAIIFGNGPSSSGFDINKIGNRKVFTVNYSSRTKNFSNLLSDFHVWADMGAFEFSEKATLESITDQLDKTKRTIFLPIESMAFINKHNIFTDKINYYYSNRNLYEGDRLKQNLASNIHGFSNVIHWAIFLAINMGIKKIYLVGVESTNVLSQINFMFGSNSSVEHSYSFNKDDLNSIKLGFEKFSMEDYAESFYLTLKHYRIIYEEAKKMGVDIINLTEKTLIDSIPKGKISDLK